MSICLNVLSNMPWNIKLKKKQQHTISVIWRLISTDLNTGVPWNVILSFGNSGVSIVVWLWLCVCLSVCVDVCTCVRVRARTVYSFHAPPAQAVLQTLIVHPPLCSNDYWLLIDSFMRCELLWLVSYRGVHMKIWSVWFMSSFWFYWGAQWTAARTKENSISHPFKVKAYSFACFTASISE